MRKCVQRFTLLAHVWRFRLSKLSSRRIRTTQETEGIRCNAQGNQHTCTYCKRNPKRLAGTAALLSDVEHVRKRTHSLLRRVLAQRERLRLNANNPPSHRRTVP